MTNDEFATWLTNHLYVARPSVRAWMTAKVSNPQETLRLWREALSGLTLDECASVVRRWCTGLLEAPANYDNDMIAARVRQAVESERKSKAAPKRSAVVDCEKPQRGDVSPIAPIVAEAIRLKGTGASPAEIEKLIAAKIPRSEELGPRYECPLCLDRGTVEVWKMDVARGVLTGKIQLEDARGSYCVACSCGAGNRFAEASSHWPPMPRYSKHEHCRYHTRSDSEEQADLIHWLNTREEGRKHSEFTQFERSIA